MTSHYESGGEFVGGGGMTPTMDRRGEGGGGRIEFTIDGNVGDMAPALANPQEFSPQENTTTTRSSGMNNNNDPPLSLSSSAAGATSAAPTPTPPPELSMIPLSASNLVSYHPSYMFCGECTSCAPPPPSTSPSTPPRGLGSKELPIHSPGGAASFDGPGPGGRRKKKKNAAVDVLEAPGVRLCCEDPNCVAPPPPPPSTRAPPSAPSTPTRGDADAVIYGDSGEAQLAVSPIRSLSTRRGLISNDDYDDDDDNDMNNIEMAKLTSPTTPHGPGTTNRSHFYVLNLTCPSQILVLNSILQPLTGITKVLVPRINDKLVHVDHDPFLIDATHIQMALRHHGYDARIKSDGGSAILKSDNPYGVCKSQLFIRNMRTNRDLPLIRAILESCKGVVHGKVAINLTSRIVYINHDPFQITPTQMCTILSAEGKYKCKIKLDGGISILQAAKSKTTVGRSHLYVSGICCNSEVPAIRSILTPVEGVKSLKINVTQRLVYVDHDVQIVTAAQLAEILCNQGFMSVIKRDANVEFCKSAPHSSKYVESILVIRGMSFVTKDRVEKIMKSRFGDGSGNGSGGNDEVQAYSCHVPSHTLKVEHDPNLVSADGLVDLLMRELGYDTTNGGDEEEGGGDGMAIHVSTDGQKEGRAIPLMDSSAGGSGSAGTSSRGGRGSSSSAPNAAMAKHMELEDEASKLHLNVVLSGICWAISMLSVIGGKWAYLEYVGLLALAFGLPPVASKAYKTLKRYQFDANCMMVIAAIGAAALGEYDEAASVAFLFSISEWLETRATLRARRALGSIVDIRPERANLIDPNWKKDGEGTTTTTAVGNDNDGEVDNDDDDDDDDEEDLSGTESTASSSRGGSSSRNNNNNNTAYNAAHVVVVPASSVLINSLVSVRTGDKVPCDGVVIEGTSTIDESSLTGEARPILKGIGDNVCGGSINVGPTQLIIRTTSTVEDSAVSRLIRLVEESQANRSPTEKLVDSFAKRYTPFVIVLAVLMCTVPWIKGPEVGKQWVYNALIIIVIACPCALTISTPVTYAAGLAATAQKGVIIKGGARLEALGRVKKVVFDKTGTLTEGRFALAHLSNVNRNDYTQRQVLELLALMESSSNHPLSACLVNAAQRVGIRLSTNSGVGVEEHSILEGEGITGIVTYGDLTGVRCYVGNQRLFERVGLYETLPVEAKVDAEEWSNHGGTIGYIGLEHVGIIGAFCVMDTIRPEAKRVISILQHEMGCEVTMLTGDSDGAGAAVGRRVGISDEHIKTRLLPEDKLHIVASMMEAGVGTSTATLCNPGGKRGLILLCGDGVNDAPAMAVADVGVAMGSGAALAMEMSDVTLMDSNLSKLLLSMKMGRRVIFTIKENIILSMVTKLVVVGLTFAGMTTLLSAIVTDVGVMLAVTLNGMKLLPRHSQREEEDAAAAAAAAIADGASLLEQSHGGSNRTMTTRTKNKKKNARRKKGPSSPRSAARGGGGGGSNNAVERGQKCKYHNVPAEGELA